MQILTNQVGYELNGPKRAVLQASRSDRVEGFRIKRWENGEVVFEALPEAFGQVSRWKDWYYWGLKFAAVRESGTYFIECTVNGKLERSFPFEIAADVLERRTLSDVIYYFKAQRCSGLLDRADRHLPFLPPRQGFNDVHGGWYDASGDYGKHLSHLCYSNFFNPQQTPLTVWVLYKTHELLERRNDPNFKEYKPRLLDEASYGADFLTRLKDPQGTFYISIRRTEPANRPEDRVIGKRMLDYSIANSEKKAEFHMSESGQNEVYEAGYRSGAGMAIAALARASRYPGSGEFSAGTYLQTAEAAFAYLEQNNLRFANDGQENILDDTCALLASVELWGATQNESYRQAARRRAENLMGRLVADAGQTTYWRADEASRPFFHPSDAGLPVVSLLAYYEIADEDERAKILRVVERSLRSELEVTRAAVNPFGYARQLVQNKSGRRYTSFFFPHETEAAPWWQGENARLASLAAAARLSLDLFPQEGEFKKNLEAYAADQLNWILGLNPYDACMLDGSGHNNPEYLYFDSYAYANCPGGICNGITAGLHDEDDIDFHLSIPGEDHDWRWGEQWLPHASWYLLAVAAGKPSDQ